MLARLGKIFVFLNAIAAVGLVTWALTLTTSRLDWVDKDEGYKPSDENPMLNDTNNLDRLDTKIKMLNDGIKASQASVATRSQSLNLSESNRDFRMAVFSRRVAGARTGFFFRQPYVQNSGLIDVNSAEPRQNVPNDAARLYLGLDNKPLEGLGKIQNDIKVSIENQSAYYKKSDELLGNYSTLTGDVGRLDDEIERQKVIFLQAIDESKYLADRRTNWDEQVKILTNRLGQLTTRIKEIQSAPNRPGAVDKVTINQ
jgi:hypothetical protein